MYVVWKTILNDEFFQKRDLLTVTANSCCFNKLLCKNKKQHQKLYIVLRNSEKHIRFNTNMTNVFIPTVFFLWNLAVNYTNDPGGFLVVEKYENFWFAESWLMKPLRIERKSLI